MADPQHIYAVLPSRRELLNHFQMQGVNTVEDAQISSSPCGRFHEYYAPGFELFHPHAGILLIGYTPGRSQADKAWRELSQASEAMPSLQRLIRCQKQAAFSGLWTQLDAQASHCSLLLHLGLDCLSECEAVSLTSRLVFPIFRAGKNYRIGSEYVKTPWLIERAGNHLRELTTLTPNLRAAIFLGDGQAALASARAHLERGDLPNHVEVFVLPHPSGANNGRISQFMKSPRTLTDVRVHL
ncbi:hypothetical protein KQ310_10575 [Synechococcus sp. CS-1328]|nr:hypothetical protein [Synechococcus sp. CS-1328]